MYLNEFVSKEPRILPIIIMADVSGSMYGEKINELNLALREMLNALKNAGDIRGKFQLSVVSFGGDVKITQTLDDIDEISLSEMSANGNTPMGEAFTVVHDMIEDRSVIDSRAYTPTIVLISDGIPTDFTSNDLDYLNWEPLKEIHSGARSSKCQRLAMGIGSDADLDMLKAFVNNPEIPVIKATDASGIAKFFRWVSMSTIARMNSVNPNIATTVAPIFDFDAEDIIL